jgi:putative tricarboxylic transport membrane protein
MTRRFGQDIAAGLMFIAFGAFGLYLARNYPVGSALQMEPGYVPRLLCWGMVGIGVIIAARGLISGDAAIARWHWRPLLFVLGGLIAFRYMIEPIGLVAATVATVVLGAMGSREVQAKDTLMLAAGLAVGAVALFVYALGLPMRVWPF